MPLSKAFILGAGLGTRMRPLTDHIPKPMVEVGGESLIRRALGQLRAHGITDVTVNTHYKAEALREHLADMPIHWSHEEELLGTGGGLRKALPHFGAEDFFVIAGDSYWTDGPGPTALERLERHWNPEIMDILLLLEPLSRMTLTQGVGDYDFTGGSGGFGPISRSRPQAGTHMFTSLRIHNPRIFEGAPPGAFSYLDLMDRAEAAGRLYGLAHDGLWHHLSTPGDVARVNASLQGGGA